MQPPNLWHCPSLKMPRGWLPTRCKTAFVPVSEAEREGTHRDAFLTQEKCDVLSGRQALRPSHQNTFSGAGTLKRGVSSRWAMQSSTAFTHKHLPWLLPSVLVQPAQHLHQHPKHSCLPPPHRLSIWDAWLKAQAAHCRQSPTSAEFRGSFTFDFNGEFILPCLVVICYLAVTLQHIRQSSILIPILF